MHISSSWLNFSTIIHQQCHSYRRFNELGPPTSKGPPATRRKARPTKFSEKVWKQWECNLQHRICFLYHLHSAQIKYILAGTRNRPNVQVASCNLSDVYIPQYQSLSLSHITSSVLRGHLQHLCNHRRLLLQSLMCMFLVDEHNHYRFSICKPNI